MSVPVLSWSFYALGKRRRSCPRQHPLRLPRPSTGAHSSLHHRRHQSRVTFALRTPRPDPQSQSFSRSYGSILPTSLIYILLSTRGCTPWRPDAVMSTPGGANRARYSNFQGSSGAHQTGPRRTCFPSHSALSPGKPIPGPLTVNKKR